MQLYSDDLISDGLCKTQFLAQLEDKIRNFYSTRIEDYLLTRLIQT